MNFFQVVIVSVSVLVAVLVLGGAALGAMWETARRAARRARKAHHDYSPSTRTPADLREDFAERMKHAPKQCADEIHVAAGDGRCVCRAWKI